VERRRSRQPSVPGHRQTVDHQIIALTDGKDTFIEQQNLHARLALGHHAVAQKHRLATRWRAHRATCLHRNMPRTAALTPTWLCDVKSLR
jgi:hypothetical protein